MRRGSDGRLLWWGSGIYPARDNEPESFPDIMMGSKDGWKTLGKIRTEAEYSGYYVPVKGVLEKS
jgi:hypothetical protein